MEKAPAHWTYYFFALYSGVLTVVFLIGLYVLFGHGGGVTGTFDRIRVHRIDIVEPDGTPRLVLSNRTSYPGSFFRGVEVPRPDRRDAAGLLMMDDEGNEDGGFIWGGLSRDGKPMSFSHLSFDQYLQDQTLSLDASLQDGERFSAIRLNDVPDTPLTPKFIADYEAIYTLPEGPQKQQQMAEFARAHPASHRRAALERLQDNSVALTLSDPEGKPRLRMKVGNDGTPVIEFLTASGTVSKAVTVTSAP